MDSKVTYKILFDSVIYAENDYKAKVKANEIKRLIEQLTDVKIEINQIKKLIIMKRMIPVQKIIDEFNAGILTKEQADERFKKLDKECPRCESHDIKLYYMNDECISIDFSNNILELECRCEDCLYDDEIFCFL